MKPAVSILLCLVAATVSAQAPAPSATAEARKDVATPSASDPRVCLEFPTRQQVIACAEKYRPRRPAAKS